MTKKILAFLLVGVVAAVGCDGNDPPEDTGADVGEACEDGADCKDSLLCFVETDGQAGKCEAIPEMCEEADLSCSDACFDDIKARCMGGSACVRFGSSITIGCATMQ
ncbi:MAG: hypothetical protein IPK82_38945 [Polyangiaceae bacterium]|nr:hypothetical protein [Polyangiaceae bacterium]